MLATIIRFFLENKLVVWLLLLAFVGWGLATAPFDFDLKFLPRDPVAVDAIPDIGENQQIVFTRWPGQSPQDVENQVTYPLTSALLGIPGVRSVRSNSMFGFSSIYLIFEEDIEFYWSRSRILEKLNSLPAGVLPDNVVPTLGPDATALGQVYWYTLEGRDPDGNPVGGWDLDELRSTQDFYVRYGLSAAGGVSEVASIGGFVKEYQVDVDPEKMRVYGITLDQVMQSVRGSNLDVGAATLEINLAEYFVRGLGYLQNLEDLESAVVSEVNNVPIRLSDIARVNVGPAERRGLLDKSGAEAVGGVVVARYGANPLEVIDNVKAKIAELAPGLPRRELEDGTISQVTIVPFYDRSGLIKETIGTLEEALTLEILITAIVVILLLFNLKSSLLVAGTLPVAVLMCFIAMRYFGVDANIVALSGIAIAIGTMVDMGIVLTESMVYRLNNAPPGESRLESIYEATVEVASAVITAVATTIISFLPVFTMEAAEGKLFRPLAFTKTFALIAAIFVSIAFIPALADQVFRLDRHGKRRKILSNLLLIGAGIAAWIFVAWWLGLIAILAGLLGVALAVLEQRGGDAGAVDVRKSRGNWLQAAVNVLIALTLAWLLAGYWLPLGVEKSQAFNFLFVVVVAGGLLGFFWLVIYSYASILRFLLRVKFLFLLLITLIVIAGVSIYRTIGQEFMPALGEGAFLLMPTAMPHAGVAENLNNLRTLDMAVTTIPEVESVVGKAGRVNSPLDPAPLSMYENMIQYKSEYATDENGRRLRFRAADDGNWVTRSDGAYPLDGVSTENLIPDPNGQYFRQWRDHIRSPDDIWNEIISAVNLPGVTSAPKLQPIETRLVMLQTGMRAPMGIKVRGTDLRQIEAFGLDLERELREVEGVKDAAVYADRIVGKPYLLLDVKRDAIARYGLSVTAVQQQIQATVGGMLMTTTVEGRERYAVRLRYPRELRNDPESIRRILVPAGNGRQIPLGDLIDIRYEQGPQSIKSEDGFLVGYVLFDKLEGYSEVEVVENATNYLNSLVAADQLEIPAGISYRFAGNYEQQVRADARLKLVLPIALALIFLILYFQFRSVTVALMVFSGVFVAFSGGFLLLGGYANPDFLDFNFFGTNLRDLFQMRTINLSVAVWVGFLALFGIATDDGVLVATFLRDSFERNEPTTVQEVRDAVVEGGLRRVRPAMMTTATTILALLPVLTATGRGADIMLPMAIPSFGGMLFQVVTMFTVPVLWSLRAEWRVKRKMKRG
ncbi:Cu(I)/Ag(I) efflux system membrane protein CusA/SilA [Lewinella aquimaris]|uniref:Cu(I)/Ag(I) efflux system membrane protein CusA/SilA n=1 Tax=Neolewinella aquimaris TaxID=1835722 RepID=A0A840E2S4_9BACT|nr:efflux RND transporter permease subunit [Neolewinella aquimaris]MBB4079400.1 Cu(I)/Ag(I) efflux system membrane protein CusA/SilA [Neolewinella aquimaris]